MEQKHIPPHDAGNHTYEIHGTGDWSALYVDGKLDTGPGDSYHVEERLEEILGARRVHDNAYLLGGTGRDDKYATTTRQIIDYVQQRNDQVERARELRATAERLLAEAKALDPDGRAA